MVAGKSAFCDLPVAIRESKFYRNLTKRISSGEAPRRTYLEIEKFLNDSGEVWENSWIRFPESRLSTHALETLPRRPRPALQETASKQPAPTASATPSSTTGRPWLRVPISYGLKLALADLMGSQPHVPERIRAEAERLLGHFSNDNTSPETTSFHVVSAAPQRSTGEQVARESARRFLFTTLLMSWANQRFGLTENGQRGMVYHGPHPPVRQTELSSCISDSFYRELFMSPCLSGWDDGEAKAEYMHLCHQVLSRSQLNSVAKLREAGLIANNLIVLPSPSNVSLANNGIHVSMGSRSLTRALQDADTADGAQGREEAGRPCHKNLRALSSAVCGYVFGSAVSHRLRAIPSRGVAGVSSARARLHSPAADVARVEGKSEAEDSGPFGDAVWTAVARSRHLGRCSGCAETWFPTTGC